MWKDSFKRILQPNGRGGFEDRLSLGLWNGWAWANQAVPENFRIAPVRALPGAGEAIHRWSAEKLRSHAVVDLLPFWIERAIDRRFGGYDVHDRQGKPASGGSKSSAKHGRMVAAFCMGYELGGPAALIEAARHGVAFMRRRLWDEQEQGWFVSVDAEGRPADTAKNLIHHVYPLLGLALFHRITGDETALDLCRRTWASIDERMRDREHGGFGLQWSRDWRIEKPHKTLGAMVNLIKACLAMHEATDETGFRGEAEAAARLIVGRMRDPEHCSLPEHWHADWRYWPMPSRDRINIGHVLEAGWTMIAIARAGGAAEWRERGLRLIEQAYGDGWDRRRGGLRSFLFRNGLPSPGPRIWWTQCEGVSALAHGWAATGDPLWLRRLGGLLDHCWRHFVDPVEGEWHTACRAEGTVSDARKGHAWKGAYHQVEAMTIAARLLEERRPFLPLDGCRPA